MQHTSPLRKPAQRWAFLLVVLVAATAGAKAQELAPGPKSLIAGASALAAGDFHTCALLAAGGVQCWGGNDDGQIGDGTTTTRLTAVVVPGVAGGAALAAGTYHTCTMLTGNTLQCWGDNRSGQLGDGTLIDRLTAVPVSGIAGAAALTAGHLHSCAVVAGGTVKCWGFNLYGQLGNGTSTTVPVVVPVIASGVTSAIAVSAGDGHTCALVAGGGVRCWGWNNHGEVGNNTTTWTTTAVAVVGVSGASAVTSGASHSCAVVAGGAVKCWGRNNWGQIGDGNTTDRLSAIAVVGVSGATALAAGDEHSCAVVAGGAVKCWGRNVYGQLGDGTTTNRLTAVSVTGISGATAIAAGSGHTCAVLSGGVVRCWGRNATGQLGDGTTANSSSPVDVVVIDSPPTIQFAPSTGTAINYDRAGAASPIIASPSGGSGAGAAATTTVGACSIFPGSAAFPTTSIGQIAFQGAATTAQNIVLPACVPQTVPVSATLTCPEVRAGGAAINHTWTLNCSAIPGTPTGVRAVGGSSGIAIVSFQVPASDGGSPITNYTITSNPAGGVDGGGPLSQCRIITGLTDGVPYTFTVTARNAVGTGAPSSPSNSAISGVVRPAGSIDTITGGGPYGAFGGDGLQAVCANLNAPSSVWITNSSNYYISDRANHRIRRVNSVGTTSTVVGTGVAGFSGDGGPAQAAQVNGPAGLMVDSTGVLYFADKGNNRVRIVQLTSGSTINTIAGDGTAGFAGDGGPASAASLNQPSSVVVDSSGLVYIADTGNRRVRRIAANGVISTIAGNGNSGSSGDGGSALAAALTPEGLALDSAGNLLIADSVNHRIRKVSPLGIISTIAGTGTPGFGGDGGTATAATLNGPAAVRVDSYLNTYIADTLNNRVRMVSPSGLITTVAGDGSAGFLGDLGPGVSARLSAPRDIATFLNGQLLIADTGNNRIRFLIPNVPSAPLNPSAVAAPQQATISFSVPASTGGLAITSYTVTSQPGGISASGASSPLTVTGLNNGTAYTFTVVATNARGNSAPSAASNSVTPATTISIGDAAITEGNAGTTSMSFTATLVGPIPGGFTVPVSTADGTATAGSDYVAIAAGTALTFTGTAGETQTVFVAIVGDTILETNETFSVALGAPTSAGVTVSAGVGTGTIINDDSPSVAIGNVTLAEGNSGTTNAVFTATLTGGVQGGFTLPVSSVNGTATSGSDYTAIAPATALTFLGTVGETQTVSVEITGDTILEPDETFSVQLGAPSNAGVTVSAGTGTGTISNDDSASVAIGNVTVAEGNSGTTNAVFTATLTGAVQGGFTVPVSSADGTATAGSDYTAIAGGTALTFAGTAGEAQTVSVAVTGDTVLETDEAFNVQLGAPSNAAVTVSTGTGTGTITNDDSASVAIGNVTVAEGNSGTTNAVFTATLTGAVQGGFTVPVSSADGTATAGSDYTAIAGGTTLTFTGTTGETRTVSVAVTGDTVLESDEAFTVQLGAPSNAGVTVSAGTGTGTITNDDSASVAIGNVTVTEGNSGTTNAVFTATLTGAVQGGFTVPVSSADGTATAGSDYTAIAGGTALTFAGTAGEAQTVSVAVTGDMVLEADEAFSVQLGAPSNAAVTVSAGSGTGTITNDDVASLTIGNASVVEGNSGTTNVSFTVALLGDVQGGFTVPVSIADGTAAAGSDFTPLAPGTVVTFAGNSGETASVIVAVNGDTVVESNETYTVNLGTPSNAAVSLSDGSGAGTINNDDAAIVMINNVTDAEGNAGASTFLFTATLSGVVQDGFTVPYQTADNTAQAGSDYTAASGNLTFTGTNGQTRAVAIAVTGDTTPELDETFHVDLLAPSVAGVTANPARGTGTIVNDDLFADISVSNSNGVNTLLPGQVTTYTVVVTNTSAVVDVPAVQITQTLPAALLGASWTCASAGGASCPASGSGPLATTLALPRGGSVTYLVSATVDASSVVPSIAATVSANVVAPYVDLNLANNSVTDTDVLLENLMFANGFE